MRTMTALMLTCGLLTVASLATAQRPRDEGAPARKSAGPGDLVARLMEFDKDGRRLASFRTYMPGGARIEASTILVERDRLLIGADPQGIYQFPHPAKSPQ